MVMKVGEGSVKLSIWQQFSSNHSGWFWVVGTFETIEQAQNSYEDIRQMLFSIDKWHRDHREESSALQRAGNTNPVPSEVEFAAKYQVRWPATIDWTNWANYNLEGNPAYSGIDARKSAERLIDQAVTIRGRTVSISSPDQTWMTTQPFEDLLAHFGAETTGYDLDRIESGEFDVVEVHPRLMFTAPDIAAAEQIETAIVTYIRGTVSAWDNVPPWNDDVRNFERVFGRSRLLKREYVERAQRNWQYRYESAKQFPYGQEMLRQRLILRSGNGRLERRGQHFTLIDFDFYNDLGLFALIAWLEVQGCSEMDYAYVREGEEHSDP
jgi:hypothetical protein